MPKSYPLEWPQGRPRWQGLRKWGAFKVSEAQATSEMLDNLESMGAANIVISTNRQAFSRSKSSPADPGVAVYFTRKGKEVCIACDKWSRLDQNLRAVGRTAEAMRSIQRWGTEDMVDAAFTGYAALLPAIAMGPGQALEWYEVLQVSRDADPDIIRAAYRNLSARYHPDNQETGNATKFAQVQDAFNRSKEQS